MDVTKFLGICRSGGIARDQNDDAFLRVFTLPCSDIISPPPGKRLREGIQEIAQEKIREGCPICQNSEPLTEDTCLMICCPGKHHICITCAKSWFQRKRECPFRCPVSFEHKYAQYLRERISFELADITNYFNHLRDQGFNFNEPIDGERGLIVAIQNGRSRIVNLLLTDYGADPNVTDSQGVAALFHIFDLEGSQTQIRILTHLIQNDVDLNVRDAQGVPFMIKIARRSDSEIAHILLCHLDQDQIDANVSGPDGYTIFGTFARTGDFFNIPHFSSFDCDPFYGNTITNDSTIQVAIEHSPTTTCFERFVQEMFEWCGSSIYEFTENNKGHTDIITCARKNKPECLEILFRQIEKSSDFPSDWIDASDNKGQTALFAACKRGHLECARLLIEKGANTFTRNSHGISAHQIALGRGHQEIVNLLEENLSVPSISF